MPHGVLFCLHPPHPLQLPRVRQVPRVVTLVSGSAPSEEDRIWTAGPRGGHTHGWGTTGWCAGLRQKSGVCCRPWVLGDFRLDKTRNNRIRTGFVICR